MAANADKKPIIIEQFAGLMTNISPFFGPNSAAEVQENVKTHREGQLNIRNGIREVTFEN